MRLRASKRPAPTHPERQLGKCKLLGLLCEHSGKTRETPRPSPDKFADFEPTFESSVLSCQASLSKGKSVAEKPRRGSGCGKTVGRSGGRQRYVRLYDPCTQKREAFRLFAEEDLRLELENPSAEQLESEPECDNDLATVNEQVKTSTQRIRRDLASALRRYLADRSVVSNILKYREESEE